MANWCYRTAVQMNGYSYSVYL